MLKKKSGCKTRLDQINGANQKCMKWAKLFIIPPKISAGGVMMPVALG